ncbi:MAG: hypothetical protein COA74_12490 [Gammaproteobacteria bacterium]|nr:MAG: hypothetical protein COA74_12490 [Gammaproteobacteria bacterium]
MHLFKCILIFIIATILLPVYGNPKIDLSDVGDVHIENSGSADAQQHFLHGLAQLHNFEYWSAAEDFQKAQKIDPDFALAYWGEAMTYNHTIWMRQDKKSALKALNKYASSAANRADKAQSADKQVDKNKYRGFSAYAWQRALYLTDTSDWHKWGQ